MRAPFDGPRGDGIVRHAIPPRANQGLTFLAANLDLRPMPDYLHAILTGEYEIEATKDAITRVVAAAHAQPSSSILLDCRGYQGHPTLPERFSIISHVMELRIKSMLQGQPARYRTAIVGAPPLLHPARYGVRMLAELNLRISIWETPEEALAWLGIAADPRNAATGGD